MVLALLAFLGGALTILSPCILPVLPFVFAKAGQPFRKSTLPLLVGMALTFAAIATLAAVGGGWAVQVNSYGRIVALVLMAAFGVALLSRSVADRISRPFVAFGNRLLQRNNPGEGSGAGQSFVLGVATGFLWAPCAGPILGLILTGAALNGPSTQTSVLLFAYALGAVTSLAVATLAGARVALALKKSLGAGEWLRRGLGVAILVGVVVIALGWDTGLLTRLSYSSTNRIEQTLLNAFPGAHDSPTSPGATGTGTTTAATGVPPIEGILPELTGATMWLNSPALTTEGLRGKVVVIDFWTYSCINCLRALPYTRAWYERYKDAGLVIIGVHTPEFAFEKLEGNVRRAIKDFNVSYPVAMDNDYAIWRAFKNRYWPAHYFVDAKGQIRGHHFGEGNYDKSEQLIRTLLKEAGQENLPGMASDIDREGVAAPADHSKVESPETYLGYARAENFTSSGGFSRDTAKQYAAPSTLQLNQWSLAGTWTVGKEVAMLNAGPGQISFRFQARDLHLVLGPGSDGKQVRFKITIDGHEPGKDRGMDVDEQGVGTVTEQRLYQLIRQSGEAQQHTFTIEFLDAGVQAYAFTFG